MNSTSARRSVSFSLNIDSQLPTHWRRWGYPLVTLSITAGELAGRVGRCLSSSMDRTIRRLGALAFLSLVAGCDSGQLQSFRLSWIKVERAEADAQRAIDRGDQRLFGVYGYAREVLGVPEVYRYDAGGCGMKMIEGTSDVVHSLKAQKRAWDYAERYNRHIQTKTGCLTKTSSVRFPPLAVVYAGARLKGWTGNPL